MGGHFAVGREIDQDDLPDAAQRLQMHGEIGPTHRDQHAMAGLGEELLDLRAHVLVAAENRDQLGMVRSRLCGR